MNQYPYPNIFYLIEELKKINTKLDKIEEQINRITKKEEIKYLEKDDNYYII